MILPVLVAIWLAGVAVAAAVPAGLAAGYRGRQHARTQIVAAAAEAALAEAEGGAWLGAAAATPVGGRHPLPALALGRVTTRREAVRVDGSLWLLVARARLGTAAGVQLAAAERGLLVRVVIDSTAPGGRILAASRPSFRRPE